MDVIKTGTILIENGTLLPRSLVLASEPYSRGWTTVTNLRSDKWAEQIRARVGAEFDRVAKALESAASSHTERDRMDTRAVIGILDDKRADYPTGMFNCTIDVGKRPAITAEERFPCANIDFMGMFSS